MKKTQRLASIGAMAALTLTIAACSAEEEPAADAPADTPAEVTTEEAPEETTEEMTESMEESSAAPAAGGDGVTMTSDIFGPACDQVPTEGPGSAEGMVDSAVGTAASNNPLFSTLVEAATAANLVDTLNDPAATYTVFGPINSAFEAVPPADLEAVLADTELLTTILTYHVTGERYDAEGLLEAGTVTSLQGGDLEIAGDIESGLTVNDANVVCGNIPTANATVFAIDSLLMPPAA